MKLSINLASQRYVNQRALKVILSCVIALLLLVLALQLNSYIENRQAAQQHLKHVDALQAKLSGKSYKGINAEDMTRQQKKYNHAKALLQRESFRWTVLFDRMEKNIPAGVSLRSFNPDVDNNSLAINGVAKSLTQLQALLDNLQTSKFKQVFLKNQGEAEVDDGRGGKRQAINFSISMKGAF